LNPLKALIILRALYDLASLAIFKVFANLSAQKAQRKVKVTSMTKLIKIIVKSSLFQLSLKYIKGPRPSNFITISTMKIYVKT